MLFTQDIKDLIGLFDKFNVAYALVGGYAVNYYGYMRTTQDIDFLIFPSKKNADNIMKALEEFGFGKAGIPKKYFETSGSAIHMGVEPNRIDLLTHLNGISNEKIFSNLKTVEIEGLKIKIIDLNDLVKAKKASNRARDLGDADELEKSRK